VGKNLDDFDLPVVNDDVNLQAQGFRETQEVCSIVVEDDHLRAT